MLDRGWNTVQLLGFSPGDAHAERLSEAAGISAGRVLGRYTFEPQPLDGRGPLVGQPAGHDPVEIVESGREVWREAVTDDRMVVLDGNGGDLRGFRPDAGQTRAPSLG